MENDENTMNETEVMDAESTIDTDSSNVETVIGMAVFAAGGYLIGKLLEVTVMKAVVPACKWIAGIPKRKKAAKDDAEVVEVEVVEDDSEEKE